MLKIFRKHFVTGLIAIGPLFLALILMRHLVRLVTAMTVNPIFSLMPQPLDSGLKAIFAKIIIALIVIFSVAIIGWAAQKFIFKRFFMAFENFLETIPFFNSIYSSIKDVAQAFFGDKRGVFKCVVFIEYPRKGLYAMGFVTQDKPWEISDKLGKEIWSIFVPSPPNPATGNFVLVPKEDVIFSSMTIEEGIRAVISGGAAVPSRKKEVLG